MVELPESRRERRLGGYKNRNYEAAMKGLNGKARESQQEEVKIHKDWPCARFQMQSWRTQLKVEAYEAYGNEGFPEWVPLP